MRSRQSWSKAGLPASLIAAFALSTALAQTLPNRSFRIEPQPVSSALRVFAAQAGIQLLFSEQDVRDLPSAGVAGTLPPRDALERLLRGTQLEFEFTESNVAVVRRPRSQAATAAAPPAAAPAESTRPAPSTRAPTSEEPRVTTAESRRRALATVEPEVTITGSRILRRDLEAASPIFTIDEQAFNETSSLGVEAVLNQLPQFVPTDTQFITGDVFPTATNTPGIGTLNLRGLGTNRTLVLIDGRRGQPANSTLVIDTNTIPASAIASVEIISGGASAAYGADAMGGVTNFKLRTNFEGASIELRSSATEAGDGEESRVSALLGANLAEGRGNVMLGLEWAKRSQVGILGRPFFESALTDSGAPATSIRLDYSSYEPSASAGGHPSQAAVNSLFPEIPAGSDVNRTTSFYVNPDGTLFKDVNALGYTGEYGQKFKLQPNGVLGQNNLNALLSIPLTRYSLFGRGHYALTDRVNGYAQVSFANTQVLSVSQPSGASGGFAASIPRDAEHPVPAELAALLDSRGPNVLSTTQFDPDTGLPIVLTGVDANWRLGRTLDFLPTRQIDNTTQLYQMLVGLNGKVGVKDWTWDAYVSHGETRSDSSYVGFASLQRYRMVAEAPFYGRAFTQAGSGATRITCTSGLPIFEDFEVSQDCIDAITINAADRTRLSQDVIEANLQGAVANLPAGELRAALGASYRKNDFDFLPDSIRETHSIIDIPISTFSNAIVRGSTDVQELYGEALIPLLSDRFLVRSLEMELGARYSDYNTAGGVPTYKALFSWAPGEYVRFRGGYQVANRAPNINELFLSASSMPVNLRGPDPCRADTRDQNGNRADNPDRTQVQALCSAIIGSGTSTFDDNPDTFIGDGRTDGGEIEVRRGNAAVKSEEGRTYTLGVVMTSPFEHALVSNLSLALDWYQARITQAIGQVSAQTTYDLCFNRDGLSNPTYSLDDPNGACGQIVRDPVSGNRLFVNAPYANLGGLETSGIDVQASWRVSLADLGVARVPGTLALNVALNRLLEFKSQNFPTSEIRENRGTLARGGQFDYRAFTSLRYTLGEGNVMLNWRRLPAIRSGAFVTDADTPFIGAESYSIFNLAGSWRLNPVVSFTAGIDNLFDREPNRVGAGPTTNAAGTTATGYYDVLGRRYYASVKLTF
jgi:iron complex outermembrane recepter protein